MLVENKFLFISLPRCASTSFHISCLRSGFKIEHYAQTFVNNYHTDVNLTLSNEEIADNMAHLHETLNSLSSKFGNEYDVISIKRDKYQRFLSIWKHIIDLTHTEGRIEVSNMFKKMKLDDVMFYNYSDLISDEASIINEFIKRNKIEKYMTDGLYTMLTILVRHVSYWHNNNPKIKWFEFGNFTELEEWVSNKTGKPFKMEKSNGSQHFDCNLKMNSDFIKRYNNIYDYYDIQKNNKTLI
jgi:hypothetical protein